MPTPIAPGVIRVQAIFQGKSGLPEDRFINTFHFRTPSGTVEEAGMTVARNKVRDFYLLNVEGLVQSPKPVVSHYSAAITRGPLALELRAYDLGAPEPRQPSTTKHDILGAAPTDWLPAEVAAVLSFSGGVGLPRERGRVYLGPLNTNGRQFEATTARVVISPDMRLLVTAAALRMSGGPESDLARWVVYSPTNNNTVIVQRGYIDDAYDTQRRRGEAPVLRTGFGA